MLGILIRCIFVFTKTDIIILTPEILGAVSGQKKWLNVMKITSCQDVGSLLFLVLRPLTTWKKSPEVPN